MSETIVTKIAGIFKYPEAKMPMKTMGHGADLIAEPEPTNAYDQNAIALYVPDMTPDANGNIQLSAKIIKCGYIPKEHAARLKGRKILRVTRGLSFDAITVEFE